MNDNGSSDDRSHSDQLNQFVAHLDLACSTRIHFHIAQIANVPNLVLKFLIEIISRKHQVVFGGGTLGMHFVQNIFKSARPF